MAKDAGGSPATKAAAASQTAKSARKVAAKATKAVKAARTAAKSGKSASDFHARKVTTGTKSGKTGARSASSAGRTMRSARTVTAPARTRSRTRSESGRSATGAIDPIQAQITSAVDRYRQLLESADRTERTLLVAALDNAPERPGEIDENLWGPAPTAAESAAAEIDQLKLAFTRRAEVANSSITRDGAADLLKVSRQAVLDHLRSGDLVGLRDGRRWLLPLWQFDADSERGFLPGIAAVKVAFPGGVVYLTQWMTRSSPDFAGRAPRDALATGEADKVASAAGALTSAGW